MSGPLEGGDVWGPGRVPHGASPPSSGPTTSLPGPLEPDPRGWEALTQAEAERDARRVLTIGELLAVVASEASENPYVGSQRQKQAWDEIKRRVAVAEREREQARQALRRIADTDDKPGSFGWDAILRLRKIAEDALAGEPDAAT